MKNASIVAAMASLTLVLSGCGSSVTEISSSAPADAPDLVAAATDWPSWRGPSRNGLAGDQNIPLEWDESRNVLWRTPVPGRGHASPTIVGDSIYLATADEQKQTQSVLSFDRKTGQQKWAKQLHQGGFPGPSQMHHNSTHANPTVVSDGEHMFAAFLNHDAIHLTALTADGQQAWQTEVGPFNSHYGYAPSPTIYKSIIIVAGDNKGGSYIAAVDRKTGDLVWRKRRSNAGSYSSPVVARVDGKDQLLISGGEQIVSYNPLNGEELWSASGTANATCGTVVWDDENVYASGGFPQHETVCVAGDGSGKRIWHSRKYCYEQSLLLTNGYLYAYTNKGLAVCWDAKTGKEMWLARLKTPVSASPVLVGDNIICANEDGGFYVFKADPKEFRLISKNQLGSQSFASPVVCGDRLYLRVAHGRTTDRQEYLYCIGNQSTQEK